MDEKRWLTINEQIAHLRARGVQFEKMDEAAAREQLQQENNFFRLTAYRKNYPKHPGGPRQGQYVRLDVAYLVDLAEIDRVLRDLVLGMALDVEHSVKMEILQLAEAHHEDGYSMVHDFAAGLDEKERRILDGEIARNRHNTYCGGLVSKYDGHFPVWVFLELLSFGKLCSFYRFCAQRHERPEMLKNHYRLRMCQTLRNAAAHNSCILNDLGGRSTRIKTDPVINREIAAIPGMSKAFRVSKMKNERVQQLATLLYTYRLMEGQHASWQLEQRKMALFVERLRKNEHFYDDNELLRNTFDFIRLLIDNWYGIR